MLTTQEIYFQLLRKAIDAGDDAPYSVYDSQCTTALKKTLNSSHKG